MIIKNQIVTKYDFHKILVANVRPSGADHCPFFGTIFDFDITSKKNVHTICYLLLSG